MVKLQPVAIRLAANIYLHNCLDDVILVMNHARSQETWASLCQMLLRQIERIFLSNVVYCCFCLNWLMTKQSRWKEIFLVHLSVVGHFMTHNCQG